MAFCLQGNRANERENLDWRRGTPRGGNYRRAPQYASARANRPADGDASHGHGPDAARAAPAGAADAATSSPATASCRADPADAHPAAAGRASDARVARESVTKRTLRSSGTWLTASRHAEHGRDIVDLLPGPPAAGGVRPIHRPIASAHDAD